MKSSDTKSMAGICKHKSTLSLSLKSNRTFGKNHHISGERDDHINASRGCQGGREKVSHTAVVLPTASLKGP